MPSDILLLAKAIKGDKEAREQFLEENKGLVFYIAKRFSEEENEDLVQAGFIGLIKALDNFNPDLGTAFSTYAVPLIMGEIKECLRKEKQVNLGRRGRDLYLRYRELSEALVKEQGKELPLSQIAEMLGVDREELVYALEAARTPKSLDETIDEDNKLILRDLIESRDDSKDTRILINELLESLDERSRYIVIQRFFAEKTQVELAAELQVSQAQICRIEKKALKKLQQFLL